TYVGSLAIGLAGFLRGRVDFRDQVVDGLLGADVGQVVGRDDGHRHQSATFDSEGVGAPGGRLADLDPHGPLVLDTRSPDGSWARRAVVQVVRVQHRVDAQAREEDPGGGGFHWRDVRQEALKIVVATMPFTRSIMHLWT